MFITSYRMIGLPWDQADAPLDDRVEDHVLEMLPQVGGDLRMDARASVEHRDDEAFDIQGRIQAALDDADRLEQLAQALEREEFRLDRDHDGIRCRQAVDRDQAEGGGAVDDDVVVVVSDDGEGLAEHGFPFGGIEQFDLRADEVDMGRDQVQALELRLDQGVPDVDLADHHLIEGPLLVVVRRKIQPGSRVRLRVRIDDEDLFFKDGQRGREVDGRRGLAHAAFLVCDCYDFAHTSVAWVRTDS